MRYDRPELVQHLAADYVLGLMPRRARWRFERVFARNMSLAAAVAEWSERLEPLDAMTADATPPAYVWRAIDRRVGPGIRPVERQRAGLRVFMRVILATAVTACAALVISVALNPTRLPGIVDALSEKLGLPVWMEAAKRAPADLGLSTMSLGISERERPRWIRAALLVTGDAAPITAGLPIQPR